MKGSKISGKCSKCGKKSSFSFHLKPEDAFCIDCMNNLIENQPG